jgi:hypothetical protein
MEQPPVIRHASMEKLTRVNFSLRLIAYTVCIDCQLNNGRASEGPASGVPAMTIGEKSAVSGQAGVMMLLSQSILQ